MGYLTRRAERAAVRGGASLAGPFFRLVAVVVVVGWPLGVWHSWVGYVVEGLWLVLVAGVVVAWKLAGRNG